MREPTASLADTRHWACVVVGVFALVVVASSCGDRSPGTAASRRCPRPAQSAADIRRFRVSGGETCTRAGRVLGYTAFGHEGSCGNGCDYHGYTCRQLPGGLTPNSSGGSYYTYEDDSCVRGRRFAGWRIVFH